MIRINKLILLCSSVCVMSNIYAQKIFPGADENTPSKSMYFSWINDNWEGSTESKTIVNLDFFKWLQDEYGMQLDIYHLDAGNLDQNPNFAEDAKNYDDGLTKAYGSLETPRFKDNFPNSFNYISKKAKAMNCGIGIWLGPDGYGNTEAEAQKRTDLLVHLCKDYNIVLFKFDAAVTTLPAEHDKYFIRSMTECRKYQPNLIALNHRIPLSEEGKQYMTTFLWEGKETYIDVHMSNSMTAPHHRAEALSRGLVPDLKRLCEDHGVCLSSCLDYWDDDLILQAFNRNLILAPEIYGNPWFLRDDEFPRLARIFNFHRKYNNILINGKMLPGKQYGPYAVSRGDEHTRLITLRNLTWSPVRYKISLDSSIGLAGNNDIEVRQFHPTEKIIGTYKAGSTVSVEVLPFRSCLIIATNTSTKEFGIAGCDYSIIRELPDQPVIVKLKGLPGTNHSVSLITGNRTFRSVTIDGNDQNDLLHGKNIDITFPGKTLKKDYFRKLGKLKPVKVPADAERLYETTCFTADNDGLEIRSLKRAGESMIKQVDMARKVFFSDKNQLKKGCGEKYLFDDSPYSSFKTNDIPVNGGVFRIDFGEPVIFDRVLIEKTPANYYPGKADVSSDMIHWKAVKVIKNETTTEIFYEYPDSIRYLRLNNSPPAVSEVFGIRMNKKMDRKKWKATNLFGSYAKAPAIKAWSCNIKIDEAAKGSYLAIAVNGIHGFEGAYAALRVDGKIIAPPDRSPSYLSNVWEYGVHGTDRNYTYYIPVSANMIGKKMEVIVLGLDIDKKNISKRCVNCGDMNTSLLQQDLENVKPEVWITSYPIPFEEKEMIINP